MLELYKLMDSVDSMSEEALRRRQKYQDLADDARRQLATVPVDEALQQKIQKAQDADKTWRGADPLEGVLDRRHRPNLVLEKASLIGVDGSQIYPDTHGPALYYLINIGSMILRQGSDEVPITHTSPELFYAEENLYDRDFNLVGAEEISLQREMAEMRTLAELSVAERKAQGGDVEHLVVAMKDGPLMLWMGERESSESAQTLQTYIDHLDTIRQTHGVPVGLTDRPRSANVVRMLWVAGLDLESITREQVRNSKYLALTDRTLFATLLEPNQRSAIFKNTARVNREEFEQRQQRVCFFYLNVARHSGVSAAQIVRVDIPEWAAIQADLVDQVQMAIYADCAATLFPYVLVRADELARVSYQEKRNFDSMVSIEEARLTGEMSASSQKATNKTYV
jgi:hypothetical protein